MPRTTAIALVLLLAACGPGPEARKARARIIPPTPAGEVFDSVGVVASAVGTEVVLDHEGSSAAGLPAGRTRFRAWAAVIAESPGATGSRVAFRFQKLGDGWALVEMTGR
ncbi:MAG: copper-binding protein [Pseudomonadota bacterium]